MTFPIPYPKTEKEVMLNRCGYLQEADIRRALLTRPARSLLPLLSRAPFLQRHPEDDKVITFPASHIRSLLTRINSFLFDRQLAVRLKPSKLGNT